MVVQSRMLCHSNGAFMMRLVVLLCISLSVIVGQVQRRAKCFRYFVV